MDAGAGDGAPVPVRVWHPSLTPGGPLLTGCGRFPLVALVHGQCLADEDPHLHWNEIANSLARSGYVVMAPNLGGGVDFDSAADMARLSATVQWVLAGSPYSEVIHPGEIGMAGHSYGGLLAMRYALRPQHPPVAVIAILGSAVSEDTPTLDRLREAFAGPRLFCWGGADVFGQIAERNWAEAAGTGHAVRFGRANHWDFFPTDPPTPCAEGLVERGPCTHTSRLTRDVVTVFFGKYLHAHLGTLPPGHLPASLIPPRLELTWWQRLFYGLGHLNAFARLRRPWLWWLQRVVCAGESRWHITFPEQAGSAFFP
jgi:hypothetical protein